MEFGRKFPVPESGKLWDQTLYQKRWRVSFKGERGDVVYIVTEVGKTRGTTGFKNSSHRGT